MKNSIAVMCILGFSAPNLGYGEVGEVPSCEYMTRTLYEALLATAIEEDSKQNKSKNVEPDNMQPTTPKAEARLYYCAGLFADESTRVDEALALLEKSIKINPSTEAYYAQGYVLAKSGKCDEAIGAFSAVIEKEGYDIRIFLERAHAKVQCGMYSEALSDIDQEIRYRGFGEDMETMELRGDIFGKQKDFKKASDAYLQAIEYTSQNFGNFSDRCNPDNQCRQSDLPRLYEKAVDVYCEMNDIDNAEIMVNAGSGFVSFNRTAGCGELECGAGYQKVPVEISDVHRVLESVKDEKYDLCMNHAGALYVAENEYNALVETIINHRRN